jgi:serine/threonine-protein kinase RsbT
MSFDATEATLAILCEHFSAPVAKVLLDVSRRRESLHDTPLTRDALSRTIAAIERALPSYLTDPMRRRHCTQDLQALVQRTGRSPFEPDDAAPASRMIVSVRDPQDLPRALHAARELCSSLRFTVLDQTKIVTAASELTRNMLQYAGGGELWLATLRGPPNGIEITAADRGPGIADVPLVMSSSYRSRTGLGMGLKGVKRIMDDFDMRSGPHLGTRVTIRKYLIEAS